jgi:hypothetical protein
MVGRGGSNTRHQVRLLDLLFGTMDRCFDGLLPVVFFAVLAAYDGGGVYIRVGVEAVLNVVVSVTNSVLAGNTCGGSGGGLQVVIGDASVGVALTNVTLALSTVNASDNRAGRRKPVRRECMRVRIAVCGFVGVGSSTLPCAS